MCVEINKLIAQQFSQSKRYKYGFKIQNKGCVTLSVKFLMGNEAIALGAVHAGVNVVSGYPGTPSTEILETVAKNNDGSVYV